jgi:uroporphyrinogen decarboxylase
MTSTERVMAALRHEEPDRVPVYEYFWPEFIGNWHREKGLPDDVDIGRYYDLDLPNHCKVVVDQTPWPSQAGELERGDGWRMVRTGWGEVVRKLDTMTVDELIEPPIKERSDLDTLPPFEPAALDARYDGLADWVRKLDDQGFCCFAKTGGPFSRTWHYRGLTQFLMDMVEDEGFARELLTRQTDLLIATTEEALQRGGHPQTVVWIADDCAYRNAPLFSPATYERLIQPQLARLCEMIHATGRLAAFESEGNMRPLLGLILDAGVDVLCNMEPRAGMDVVELKQEYGDRVAFIGTMCNTVVLPSGTPESIQAETLRTLQAGVGGGVVFGSAHSIGTDVSIANYEAFINTLREHGAYPLRV